jgi:hypothetical protein
VWAAAKLSSGVRHSCAPLPRRLTQSNVFFEDARVRQGRHCSCARAFWLWLSLRIAWWLIKSPYLQKGKETFKILQTKKKKGEEETLYVSNLQKSPWNWFCSANSSQITKEEKKASALSVMETSNVGAFLQKYTHLKCPHLHKEMPPPWSFNYLKSQGRRFSPSYPYLKYPIYKCLHTLRKDQGWGKVKPHSRANSPK